MKTAIKQENYEFLVIYLKHVTGLTGLANPKLTQKPWAINHENGHRHENDEVLVKTLKHISGLTGHANPPGTPKLWASSGLTSHPNHH